MLVIIEKVANTRYLIQCDLSNATHDDVPEEAMFMQEIVASQVSERDGRVLLTFQIVDPDGVGTFAPGEIYDLQLHKQD